MSERYDNLEDEIYYNIIDRGLLNRRISKNIYWYSKGDIITAQYIKTYEKLCESQQNIESIQEKIKHKKDKIKRLIDSLAFLGNAIGKFFLEPQIKQAEQKLNTEFVKSLKLKYELKKLIDTDFIQNQIKKYREQNPWPKGFV